MNCERTTQSPINNGSNELRINPFSPGHDEPIYVCMERLQTNGANVNKFENCATKATLVIK